MVQLETLVNIETWKHNANAMVEDWKYNFYTCSREPFKIDTFRWDTEAVIITGNWASVGWINYFQWKFDAYQRTYILTKKNNNIHLPYLFYFLKKDFRNLALKANLNWSVPYIKYNHIAKLTIPLPSLEEQKRIVWKLNYFTSILDTLKSLFHLSTSQYEYYRNQFLNYSMGGGRTNKLFNFWQIYDINN